MLAHSVFARTLDPEDRMPVAPSRDERYSKSQYLSRKVSRWRADTFELTPIKYEDGLGEPVARKFVPILPVFIATSAAPAMPGTHLSSTPPAVRMFLSHVCALASTYNLGDEKIWRRWELDVAHGISLKFISGYLLLISEWRSRDLDERESSWPSSADLESVDNTVTLSEFFAGLKLQGPMIDYGCDISLPTEPPGAELWQSRGHQLTNPKLELVSYFPDKLCHGLDEPINTNALEDFRRLYYRPRDGLKGETYRELPHDRGLRTFDVAIDYLRANTAGLDSFALARVRDNDGELHNCLIIVQNKAQTVESETLLDETGLKKIVDGVLKKSRGVLFVTDPDQTPSHPLFRNFRVFEKHVIVVAAVHGECTVTEEEVKNILQEKSAALTVAYGGADDIAQMVGPSLRGRVAARLAYASGAAA